MLRSSTNGRQSLRAFAPLFILAIAVVFWRLAGGSDTARLRRPVQPEIVRAVEMGDQNRTAELLAAGVNPNAARLVYHYPPGTGNERNRFAPTPVLQIAVRNRNLAVARLLLERGADPNARGPYDYTALHLAAANNDVEMTRLLLNFETDPNAREAIRGETPLHRVVWGRRDPDQSQKRVEVAQLLLKAGADPRVQDRSGVTPTEAARRRGETTLLAVYAAQSPSAVH